METFYEVAKNKRAEILTQRWKALVTRHAEEGTFPQNVRFRLAEKPDDQLIERWSTKAYPVCVEHKAGYLVPERKAGQNDMFYDSTSEYRPAHFVPDYWDVYFCQHKA